MRVYKYRLPMDDYAEITFPEGAKILSVDEQNGGIFIWALVEPEAPQELRRFIFAGTGHLITEPLENLEHIGTFHMLDSRLIWHIFEIIK